MFLVIEKISIPDALILSLIGFSIVFVVLVSLMFLIKLITAVMRAIEGGNKAPADPVQAVVQREEAKAISNIGKVPAVGSVGECLLHSVDDKTAALLMSIVADDLKAPLNELRFISIKEL